MVAIGSALAAVSITIAALFGAGFRDAIRLVQESELAEEALPDVAQSAGVDSRENRISDVVDVLGKLLEHKPTFVCNVSVREGSRL